MTDISAVRNLIDRKSILIFDFDGVLADSVDIKTKAFAELYAPYGQQVVDQVVAHHQANGGMSRYEKFPLYHLQFLGEALSDGDAILFEQRFSQLVVDAVIAAPEISGATAFLQQRMQSAKCFINSATPQNELQRIVSGRGLSDYFTGVYGAPASKLQNLQTIIADNHCDPEACLFFGDALADYQAAKKAHVDFIGIGDDIKTLLPKGAESVLICQDFSQLIQ